MIANAETGVLSIRATSRQHEKVQEFLDQVMASAKRQVLIEATVAEVQLNNQYQRGIDWQRLRRAPPASASRRSSGGTPAGSQHQRVHASASRPAAGLDIAGTLKLLESFGNVRVLSSPKLSVLNNQTAILKVVDNLVYFTVTANTVAAANSAVGHHLHHHRELRAGGLHHERDAADQRERHACCSTSGRRFRAS